MRAGISAVVAVVALLVPSGEIQAGRIISHECTVTERPTTEPRERPEENLLDTMDVYALSPNAVLLRPRMVTPQLAASLLGRKGPDKAEWERIIAEASRSSGLPAPLIAAVIETESSYDAAAVSPKGAQGAMQLMPETQRTLGVADPYDARENVMAGCAYLKRQWTRFPDLRLALAAYNAGPGAVQRFGGIPPYKETRDYVDKVLRLMQHERNTRKEHHGNG